MEQKHIKSKDTVGMGLEAEAHLPTCCIFGICLREWSEQSLMQLSICASALETSFWLGEAGSDSCGCNG